MKIRDLMKDELDIEEDRVLASIAEKRMATFDRKPAKTHPQIWDNSERPRR
jgi:hypothetical protein